MSIKREKTPISIFLDIYHNRYNLQNKMKELLGIDLNVKLPSISSDENESVELVDSSSFKNFPTNSKEITFQFNFPYKEFIKIYPEVTYYKLKNKRRKYIVLKQNAWVDVINDTFLKEYNLQSNFIYKKSYVSIDTSKSKYYLTFKAKCKDDNCGNDLFRWCDSKPIEGEPLKISILTKNTIGHESEHITKRPLRGEKRKIVGKYLERNLACNWRRENVADMEFGQFSPPNLYRKPVLRKLKEETINKKLRIVNKCPIQSLIEFKYNSNYSGSIHSLSADPFIVHYWHNYQNIIYKDVSKKYCKLSIDATGG